MGARSQKLVKTERVVTTVEQTLPAIAQVILADKDGMGVMADVTDVWDG